MPYLEMAVESDGRLVDNGGRGGLDDGKGGFVVGVLVCEAVVEVIF